MPKAYQDSFIRTLTTQNTNFGSPGVLKNVSSCRELHNSWLKSDIRWTNYMFMISLRAEGFRGVLDRPRRQDDARKLLDNQTHAQSVPN